MLPAENGPSPLRADGRVRRPHQFKELSPVKVIASSLRKGNIVDVDGRLYVILTAENIHPGKGTPVTQVDMRRLSDGVKSSQRYKTTEQVERALVEDRPYQFLYADNDGFHFANMETYDQIAVPKDVVGDQAAYLAPEMKVTLSVHEGVTVGIELPQRTVPQSRDRAHRQGSNRIIVIQASCSFQWRADNGPTARGAWHPHRGDDSRWVLR